MCFRHALGIVTAFALTLPAVACSGSPGPAGPSPVASLSSKGAVTAPPFPVAENKRPGTSAWRIRHLGADDAIEGYADQRSGLPGQSFRLSVSTTAPYLRVQPLPLGRDPGHPARPGPTAAQPPRRPQASPHRRP